VISPSVPTARMLREAFQPVDSNVQSHHGLRRRRLTGYQNRGANLCGREDEVVRTVKLYQKAKLESVGKYENPASDENI